MEINLKIPREINTFSRASLTTMTCRPYRTETLHQLKFSDLILTVHNRVSAKNYQIHLLSGAGTAYPSGAPEFTPGF